MQTPMQLNYPGIDRIKTKMIFRMMGYGDMRHRIGAGFMRKAGIRDDQIDRVPTYYSLIYITRGKGEYIDARGGRYPLYPGGIFQRFPGHKHSTVLDPGSDWAEYFIDFDPQLYQTFEEMGAIRCDMPVFYVNPMISYERDIYQLISDMEKASPEELFAILIRTMDILNKIYSARIDENSKRGGSFIRQACDLLMSSSFDRTNLRSLVESQGWGYEWFRKIFRRELGISPWQYVLRHRLETACNMMLSTDMTISQISARLGYKTPYEFSAQFRKYFGRSPGQYRKERITHSRRT